MAGINKRAGNFIVRKLLWEKVLGNKGDFHGFFGGPASTSVISIMRYWIGFNMSKVVVTGATGFIGAKLTAVLARDHQVVALTRRHAPPDNPKNVEWFQVPPGYDSNVLTPILKGADCIVHLADSPERGTANQDTSSGPVVSELLNAMKAVGVGKVIVASSIYARLAEEGNDSAYGSSKLKAEQMFQASGEIQPIILRLPPVYGPASKGGFSTLVGIIKRGYPVPFARAQAERAYLSLQNLSDLILCLVKMPEEKWQSSGVQIFEPSDGLDISTTELTEFIANALDKSILQLGLPLWLLSLLGILTGKSQSIKGAIEPLTTRNTQSLRDACGWLPAEHMPESLGFLKNS